MTNDTLTLKMRGLRGIMTVEALPQGARVTFTRGCGKSTDFSFDLSDEEYTACTGQAMDHTWQSRQCRQLQAEWTALFRATGQAKNRRVAFAKAMSFLAERLLTDSECCRVFKEKLAEVLRSEYYRQLRQERGIYRVA
jgi:hypothetical protein